MSENRLNPEQITIYGTKWCPDSRRSQFFFMRKRIPIQFIDIDQVPEAEAFVKQVNQGFRSSPTIVFPDGTILVEPTDKQLSEKISI